MRGHNNRRLRIWRLDGRAIGLILNPNYQITRGLPSVTVVDARFDGVRNTALLVLESPLFAEVPDGEFIPEIDVILTGGLNVAS